MSLTQYSFGKKLLFKDLETFHPQFLCCSWTQWIMQIIDHGRKEKSRAIRKQWVVCRIPLDKHKKDSHIVWIQITIFKVLACWTETLMKRQPTGAFLFPIMHWGRKHTFLSHYSFTVKKNAWKHFPQEVVLAHRKPITMLKCLPGRCKNLLNAMLKWLVLFWSGPFPVHLAFVRAPCTLSSRQLMAELFLICHFISKPSRKQLQAYESVSSVQPQGGVIFWGRKQDPHVFPISTAVQQQN